MGKKRTVKKHGGEVNQATRERSLQRVPKVKLSEGILYIEATYNNTRVALANPKNGGIVMWASSGALGFSGAKRATPFAAAKVADLIAEKANTIGVKNIEIITKGIGPGRESAIRSFVNRGFSIDKISDRTPVPHNGPRAKKPRRV